VSKGQSLSGTEGILNRIVWAFKEVVFPAKCLVCGSLFTSVRPMCGRPAASPVTGMWPHPIGESQNAAPENACIGRDATLFFKELTAPFLCGGCADKFSPTASPMCTACGTMFKSREGADHLCENCIRSPGRYRMARSAGIYEHSLRTMIHRLKYDGKVQLARPLGKLLRAAFFKYWNTTGIELVVPVPLHKNRFRKRGFNQAYLLIREWIKLSTDGRPLPADTRVAPRTLVRNRPTRPQTGLGKKGRMENIKDAFTLSGDIPVAGQRVLLVDDVFTTGATVGECAGVLMKGGARHVDVLTLARSV
jgi:ComF family protein